MSRTLLIAFLLASLAASAQSWTGGAGDNLWSSGGNWSGGVPPPSANTTFITFPGGAATFAPNADAAWMLNRIDITGATPYGLAGSELTFDGTAPALNVSGAGHSIANPLLLGAITTLTHTNDFTLSGNFSGPGGFSKFGASRLTLSGTTPYSGATTINSGAVRWTGSSTVFDIIFAGAGVAEFNVPGGIAINSVLNGPGTLSVVGGMAAGVFGPMLHTGPTSVSTSAQLDGTMVSTPLLTLDGTFQSGDSVIGALAGTGGFLIVNGSTFTVGGANTSTTFNGAITGFANFIKVGTGRLTLAVTSMHNGATTVNGGILKFGDGVTGPGTLFDIFNNGAVEFNVPGGIAINSVMNGSGSVTVLGGIAAGVFGPMLYTGATTVNFNAQFDAFVNNSASLTLDGTFQTGGATFGQLTGATGLLAINSGTFTTGGNNASTTFSGCIAGPGDLVKVGTGRLTLPVTCTHNGATTVNGGIVAFGDGVTGPGTVFDIFNNAAVEFNVPTGIAINSVMNGTGSLTVVGGMAAGVFGPMLYTGATTVNLNAQFDASVTNSASLTLNGTFNTGGSTFGQLTGSGLLNINSGTFTTGGNNASTTFTGCVGGVGDLIKVGTGRLTHAGICTHNGITRVNAGILAFGNGVAGPPTVFDIVNNASVEFNVPTGIAINSVMNGSGSLTVVGGLAAGVFGPMVYTGPTTVNAGAQFDASVANSASLALNGNFNTGGSTFGALTGAGLMNVNSGTVTVGSAGTSTTFSGSIASAGAFVKTGAGRLTLSGNSTLTGTTTISAGSIALTGTTTSPITVASGATLFGTGTASGGVTVNAGGNLAPGLSPGQLNTGNLAIAGNLLQEIEGAALGAQYDNVNVTGTVNVTGGTLTLSGAFVPVNGQSFTIITNDGADAVVGTFAGLPEGATIPFNTKTLTLSYVGGTGNDVVLTVAASPIPTGPAVPTLSQWMLALLASLLLVAGALAARRVRR